MKVLRSTYSIPSRKKIVELLDLKYDSIQNVYKTHLQKLSDYFLTADLWTDNTMKSYLGITIHYLDDQFELEKGVLGVFPMDERSTSDYIVECFKQVMNEFGLEKEKVVVVVTDEGANMKKAVEDFFGPEKHLFCAVHLISHIIPDVLAMPSCSIIDNIIKKIKNIIKIVKKSSVATKKLEKLQKDDGIEPLRVIQDVKTRFTSKKDLIGRFLKLEKYMHAATSECAHPPEMVTRHELQILHDIFPCMESVCEVITELSGDKYPTCSLSIPAVNCMIGIISESIPKTTEGSNFIKNVLAKSTEKLKKLEKSLLFTVSTILDPRFKRMHNKDIGCVTLATQFINRKLQDPINKTDTSLAKEKKNQDPNNKTVWSYHAKLQNKAESHYSSKNTVNIELKQFFDQERIDMDNCPIRYWNSMSMTFPLLYKIGRKYTSLIGTSIPSERVFSLAGRIKSDLRNKLSGDHLNKLVFLGSISSKFWNLNL